MVLGLLTIALSLYLSESGGSGCRERSAGGPGALQPASRPRSAPPCPSPAVVIYQHPEDKNQAWFPKLIVLLGFSVAIWTVLLFPLDVANNQACTLNVPLSSCSTTMPMEQLWWAVYIANICIVFAAVPFAIFFYEADSDV